MQDTRPSMQLQNGTIAAPGGQQASAMDTLGFYVNVLNLFQLAGTVIGCPVLGAYVSSCPNKESVNELHEILHSWKGILNNLAPEQKARFEIDCPGEFDSMMRAISEYEEHLEDLNFDLRQNPWARYLPKTQLSQVFNEVSERIRNLDREYKATTKNYRRARGRQATGNIAPAPGPTPAPTNAAADVIVTERRLIDQYTIDQTERYRSIMRVYANYNMSPSMQSTYSAIQNFVTSLLSRRPENSVTMVPV